MAYRVYLVACLLFCGILFNQAEPGTDERVQAAKQQLGNALANSDAAWTDYVNEYGGGSVLNLIAGPKTKDLPDAARANVFKRNFKAALRAMDKLNKDAEAEGYDAVAFGINSHAHLDAEDYAALRSTGLRTAQLPAPTSRRAGPQATAQRLPLAAASAASTTCSSYSGNVGYTLGNAQASASVDWVAQGFVTGVRNQYGCGACAVFGATALTEWVLMQRNKTYNNMTTDLSEDDLMQCESVQHDPIHAPSWNACQGSPLHSFIAAASCNGQGTEASFPYDAVDDLTCNASPEAIAERSAVQNLSWAFVPSYPNSNADLMRAVTYAPTLIGLRASGKAWQYYRTGVMPCSADADVTINTHAVAVVGYGYDKKARKEFYTIKNSWGAGWGEQGFIRVERNCGYSQRYPYGPFNMFLWDSVMPVLNA
uniref:Peptidase C1A papain C-terminal domain-containing protein n=1 Tax=Tetradesmus obliquus TaxID=3088 RepID=A0A383VNK1_TETOB|eukprot:jgi/Sobl393_1/19420/SZX65986.1